MCIPLPKSWKFEKDLRFTFDLWRLQTPLYNDTQGRTDIKTRENHGKEVFFFFFKFLFSIARYLLTILTYKQCMIFTLLTELYSTTRKGSYSTTYECIFHQLSVKNTCMNINVVKSDLLPAQFEELGFVWAKKYLAGHHDWRPAARCFQPYDSFCKLIFISFSKFSHFLCKLRHDCCSQSDSGCKILLLGNSSLVSFWPLQAWTF